MSCTYSYPFNFVFGISNGTYIAIWFMIKTKTICKLLHEIDLKRKSKLCSN